MVHEAFSMEKLIDLYKEHADAVLIAHPESEAHMLKVAKYIGSTSGLLNYVKTMIFKGYTMILIQTARDLTTHLYSLSLVRNYQIFILLFPKMEYYIPILLKLIVLRYLVSLVNQYLILSNHQDLKHLQVLSHL